MSQLSNKKYDDEYASKKKRLHPRPEDDEPVHKSNKKLKSNKKSISKSKLSTQKKCEVTFSEGVEEITDRKVSQQNDKENNQSVNSTPFKSKSPSKTSLKSVKEHVKTPFSKIKDNSQEPNTPIESRSITNSATKITNQPNFNKEIIKESESKNSNKVTPQKSSKKVDYSMNSKLKSRSKSPLVRIKEEKNETGNEDNNSNEQVEKNSHREDEEQVGPVHLNATSEEIEQIKHEANLSDNPVQIHPESESSPVEEKVQENSEVVDVVEDGVKEEISTENKIPEGDDIDTQKHQTNEEVHDVKEEVLEESSPELEIPETVKESLETISDSALQNDQNESSPNKEN